MSMELLSTLQLGELADTRNTSHTFSHDAELLFQFRQAGDFALQNLNTILALLQLPFDPQAVPLPEFLVSLVCRIIPTFVLVPVPVPAQQRTQEILSCLAWTELRMPTKDGGARLFIIGFEHACLHEEVV